MKQLLLLVLLCPFLSAAQNKTHRFQNDTLYTSSGFKIYAGQTLRIGKRPNDFTGFRFISKISTNAKSLENNSVVVKELSGYGYSPTGSAEIDVKAAIDYRDGSKGLVVFTLAFDLAIGSRLPGTAPSELILPKENLITVQQALAMQMPALENDTLYTSSGFKIYKGQLLQFGSATGFNNSFRYVDIINPLPHSALEHKEILVWEVKGLSFSVLGNAYIDIMGTLVVKNKRKEVEIRLAFDHAIENIPGIPSEVIVPDEFKGKRKKDAVAELARIEKLYHSKIITKEELEAATKFLSAQ